MIKNIKYVIFLLVLVPALFLYTIYSYYNYSFTMAHFSSFSGAISNSAFSDQKKDYAICTNSFSSFSDISCNRFELTTPNNSEYEYCQVVQSRVRKSFLGFLLGRYRIKFVSKVDEEFFVSRLNEFEFSKSKAEHNVSSSANPMMKEYDQFQNLRYVVVDKINCKKFHIYEVEAK